jgi:hypothetical protein
VTAAVFAAGLLLGVRGAAPAVSVGDSGEFAAAAAVLGVPHAPGYPLYLLAARAFGTLLPWATWAWRLNLFSGVCAAGALALFADAARRRGAGAPAACFGAACLGLSPLWLHTNAQAEVFALNLLLAAALLRVAVRPEPWGRRSAAASGLLLGLATGNHHTLALAVPALAAAAWLRERPTARTAGRAALTLAAFAVLGAAVQLYLPLRAAASPPLDVGHPADLPAFLHVLLRRDYGSLSLTVDGAAQGGLPAQSARWLAELRAGLGLPAVLLAALGLGVLAARREGRADAALAAGLALAAGPLFLALGDPPFDAQTSYALKRFWLLSWLGVAGLAAAGAEAAGRLAARTLGAVPARGALWALPFLCALAAWSAAPAWSQRWDLAAHDHGRNLLRSLPPGAALSLDGGDDNFYTVAAARYADGRRPDVRVVDRGGLVFASPYGADFRALPKEAKEGRRVSAEASVAAARPFFYATLRRELKPWAALDLWGLLRRPRSGGSAEPAATPQGRALWKAYVLRSDAAFERTHYRVRALTPFYPAMRAAAAAAAGALPAALRSLAAVLTAGADVRWAPPAVSEAAQWAGYAAMTSRRAGEAAQAYALAARAEPANAGLRSNLGAALEALGRAEEARAEYARAAALAPADPQPRFNMGVLLYKAGDYAAAAAEFGAAARLPGAAPEAAVWAERAARRAAGGRR